MRQQRPYHVGGLKGAIPAGHLYLAACDMMSQPSNVHNASPGYCLSENIRLREDGGLTSYKRQAEIVQTT